MAQKSFKLIAAEKGENWNRIYLLSQRMPTQRCARKVWARPSLFQERGMLRRYILHGGILWETDNIPVVLVKLNRSGHRASIKLSLFWHILFRPSSSCGIWRLWTPLMQPINPKPSSLSTIRVKLNVKYWPPIPFWKLLETQRPLETTIHLALENISKFVLL